MKICAEFEQINLTVICELCELLYNNSFLLRNAIPQNEVFNYV